jgi:hypothetical protein
MQGSIATRWQLVLERYDEDALYLAAGAPRRWYAPGGGGFAVEGAATRFGAVSVAVSNAAAVGGGAGEDATAAVGFAPWPPGASPGVNATPAFALRLRGSDRHLALVPASVSVTTGATLLSVDVARERVWVALTGTGAATFTVTAQLR